jgi:hypothetical protein
VAKARISSFEKKPEVPVKPESASAPMISIAAVNGIARRKPLIRSMSWRLAIAAMIDPAAMNRSALKKAWVMRWNSPAE